MHCTVITSGRYQGYILESLPDPILELVWQELDGDSVGSPAESRAYSEEEKRLLEAIVMETVNRWHQGRVEKLNL